MKVKDIIHLTRDYNLHSHTQFCDGRAAMEIMAAQACREGMLHYAFTPHSPTSVESPCNMEYGKVDAFLAECDRLRDKYEGRMHIHSGMEIDFINVACGPHSEYYRSLPLDIRIGSVHFVPDFHGVAIDCDGNFERFSRNLRERFRGDVRYVVEKYFGQVATMIAFGGFDILGHFDKIAANASTALPGIEEQGWYINTVEHLMTQIIDAGIPVEINTKAYADKKRFFPAVKWWRRLAEAGVDFVINSDAHHPDRITASRCEAFAILDGILKNDN